MQVIEVYSHKGGRAFFDQHHPAELEEVYKAISACDAEQCLKKISKEKTKSPLLFSPVAFNQMIKNYLCPLEWSVLAEGSKKGFKEPRIAFGKGRFREMDGIKNKVGLEIQFGKYAFMGYDIFSKMPIFAKKGLIECGIEIVAMPDVVKQMSTGVSSFDQIYVDMTNRGEADIDIPTLVIGIGLTDDEKVRCENKRQRFLANRQAMIASGEVSKGFNGESPGPKGAEYNYSEESESE